MESSNITNFPARVEVTPEHIPDELKQRNRWLVWRWHQRNGKATKPPFTIQNKKAAVDDPNTWTSFDEVMSADSRFSGIGFVLTDDDDILAYDLDHCLDPKSGKLQDWAEALITKLDSYTEVTPSGDGLRVIIRGDVPTDGRQKRGLSSPNGEKRGAVECYKNKRYITVTGNHYPFARKTIEVRPDSIWKEFFETSPKEVSGLLKNPKANKLWNGEHKEDYGSQSDADLALCRYLADFTEGDPKKVDELFRKSKLYRPKWDEKHYSDGHTYGQETIRVAIESYEKSYHLTDTGDAKRFAKLIGNEVRYCNGRWYIWDGKRLCEDITYRIYTYLDKLCASIVEEAKQSELEERQKKLVAHARTIESKSRTEAILSLARAREPLPVLNSELDNNPHAFNCDNGIMEKGDLRPHAFEELMTKISPVSYDPRADCPTWDKFLEDVMGDQSMIDYLARCVGYSMTGLTSEQVIFFVYGLGANGKSTFLNTIMYVMGEYARVIPTDLLMVGKDQHPTALADLRGIRMALASEIEEGRRFNEQLIKSLTGGERIVARRMHQDFFEFDSTAKLWLMGNHKPTIRGTDYAIRRRFQLIPFTKTIEKDKQNPLLKDELKRELDGILNWCVKGYLDWCEKGLQPPATVLAATNEYFEEQDTIGIFLTEECDRENTVKTPHKTLYDRYVSFVKLRNEYVLSSKAFGQKIKEKGFEKDRSTGGITVWQGIKLKQNVQNDMM